MRDGIKIKILREELVDHHSPYVIKGPWWTWRGIIAVAMLQLWMTGVTWFALTRVQEHQELERQAKSLVCDTNYFHPWIKFNRCD